MSFAYPRRGPPEGVLFDLDGTLLDTAPDLLAALAKVAQEAGYPWPEKNLRAAVTGGSRGLLAGLGVAADDPALPQLQARFLACYGEALAVATRPFPGVEDLLTALEARGIPWGVVTNKPARFTEPLLAALGLAVRAACVVSGDTTRHAKPHPEPLVYACKRLGLSPWRCWYLGDAERDIRAGRWAGMVTVAAEYGYIDPEDAPDLWGAHGLIAHPRELLPHLMAG